MFVDLNVSCKPASSCDDYRKHEKRVMHGEVTAQITRTNREVCQEILCKETSSEEATKSSKVQAIVLQAQLQLCCCDQYQYQRMRPHADSGKHEQRAL